MAREQEKGERGYVRIPAGERGKGRSNRTCMVTAAEYAENGV